MVGPNYHIYIESITLYSKLLLSIIIPQHWYVSSYNSRFFIWDWAHHSKFIDDQTAAIIMQSYV